jgi:hypothetical protein
MLKDDLRPPGSFVHEDFLKIVTSKLWKKLGVERMSLDEFTTVQNQRPFDYIYTFTLGEGSHDTTLYLQNTFLTFFAKDKLRLDSIHPFIPSWDLKQVKDWQTVPRGCLTKANFNGEKSACISNPLQINMFMTNAIHTDGQAINSIFVKLGRHDNVTSLLEQIILNWPGLQGRNFVGPEISQLELSRDGMRVSEKSTTETMSLFDKSAEYRVVFNG